MKLVIASGKSPHLAQSKPASVLSGLPGSALLIAILVMGFVHLAQEMLEGDLARFDEAILMAFRTAGDAADLIGPPWVEELGRDVTALGSFAFLGFLFTATVGYLLLTEKRGLALLVGASVIGGVVVSTALKMASTDPGPIYRMPPASLPRASRAAMRPSRR